MRQTRAPLAWPRVILAALIGLMGACKGSDSTGPADTTGSIRVATVTTGADLDPDGYQVALDGGSAQSIAINTTVTVSGVSTGSHSVALSGLTANCSVSGSNPKSVSVSAGATANVSFDVACTALTGNIEVAVNATGANVPTSFAAKVDGTAVGSVTTGSSETLGPYDVGDHDVELDLSAATNCTLSSGTNPRTVTVPTGASQQTVTTTFDLTCMSTQGYIEIGVSATGADIPTSFNATVDGNAVGTAPTGSSATFGPYSIGNHDVELDLSAAGDCSLSAGANPRTVTVTSGTSEQTVTTTYELTCMSTQGYIAIAVNATGTNIPTSFLATIDGVGGVSVPAGSSATFGPYSIGDHSVELNLSVGGDCSLSSGANPRTVTATSGTSEQTVTTTFEVTCVSTQGYIEVAVNATGADIPNSFVAVIDGLSGGAVPAGSSATFGPYSIGDHDVELSLGGGGSDCSLSSGTNPRTVTVPSGTSEQTVTTTFELTCMSIQGYIQVQASASGTNTPFSSSVTIGGNVVGSVQTGSSATFGPYALGTYSVGLSLAGNCTLDSGTNPRDVTVPSGLTEQTATTAFAFTCN